jgi:hypothetical protein
VGQKLVRGLPCWGAKFKKWALPNEPEFLPPTDDNNKLGQSEPTATISPSMGSLFHIN